LKETLFLDFLVANACKAIPTETLQLQKLHKAFFKTIQFKPPCARQRSRDGDRVFLCTHERFSDDDTLLAHMRTHNGNGESKAPKGRKGKLKPAKGRKRKADITESSTTTTTA
jgi:hypothetical protein